ncbi:3'-5' RNA exonuclease complex component [Hypoxylon texense]
MAIKYFGGLALAGSALAQMSGMDHSSMMSSSATSLATMGSSWTTSMPSMSSYTTSEASSMPMSDHTMSSATVTVSHVMTHSFGDMPMSTGGSMSNATATGTASSSNAGGTEETQVPALGAGVVSGVSVGLFVVSMGLTALIQL